MSISWHGAETLDGHSEEDGRSKENALTKLGFTFFFHLRYCSQKCTTYTTIQIHNFKHVFLKDKEDYSFFNGTKSQEIISTVIWKQIYKKYS